MKVCIITGSAGLIGSEAVRYFAPEFDLILGIDNDQRAYFFGHTASTRWNVEQLEQIPNYVHYDKDIRDYVSLSSIFFSYRESIKLIIHTAAQPSHDWAAKEPLTDFAINANGTLNLLELTRKCCPEAVFIFTSTNKVYGDRPNRIPLDELDKRYEPRFTYNAFSQGWLHHDRGFSEETSIDNSTHSVFGASKAAADLMCQEYGKYFGLNTGIFRGGCLTGPNHSGTMLHGFLSYLVKCAVKGDKYTIYGYKGKQVRDNIHSYDLITAFDEYYKNPRKGEVYNIGGGRHSNCSVLEAIDLIQEVTGKELDYTISEEARIGDHKWYISDVTKFKTHYPNWSYKYSLRDTVEQIVKSIK
jgi:CDP-paratose 2-epimerase